LLEAPEHIMELSRGFSYQKYCNIQELRRGIIVRFRSRLESYGIPLAFEDLKKMELFVSDRDEFSSLLKISTKQNEHILIGYKNFEVKGIRKFISRLKETK
jgi:hypothetical protein